MLLQCVSYGGSGDKDFILKNDIEFGFSFGGNVGVLFLAGRVLYAPVVCALTRKCALVSRIAAVNKLSCICGGGSYRVNVCQAFFIQFLRASFLPVTFDLVLLLFLDL